MVVEYEVAGDTQSNQRAPRYKPAPPCFPDRSIGALPHGSRREITSDEGKFRGQPTAVCCCFSFLERWPEQSLHHASRRLSLPFPMIVSLTGHPQVFGSGVQDTVLLRPKGWVYVPRFDPAASPCLLMHVIGLGSSDLLVRLAAGRSVLRATWWVAGMLSSSSFYRPVGWMVAAA